MHVRAVCRTEAHLLFPPYLVAIACLVLAAAALDQCSAATSAAVREQGAAVASVPGPYSAQVGGWLQRLNADMGQVRRRLHACTCMGATATCSAAARCSLWPATTRPLFRCIGM